MNKIERISELVKQLNQYRHEYYNLNRPTVSDATYEILFDELSQLEKETGFILSISPTQSVGYDVVSKLEKRTHKTPLKSLDKTKSVDELNKWRKNKDTILMLKADGLTIELDYVNGSLVEAATRGNGEVGELVTTNALKFKNVPKTIPFKGTLRIVGEAIIHKNDFEEMNSRLPNEEKYATPRNLVAGSVRQLNSKICAERNVYFYAFGILECSEELSDSKYENFKWLGNQGFWDIINMKINEGYDTPTHQLEEYIKSMQNIANELNMPIDGLVASFDSVSYSSSLKETSHHPLHSIAFKFKDDAQITTLKEIEWSVGRTGQITPVAIFNPVEIDGTEVIRASVHNLTIMEELELGIGDEISIIKANMIIPQIEENFTRSNNIQIPTHCPKCNGETVIEKLNDSKVLKCKNSNCPAQLVKKFSHFVSRDAMNIDGLSEATLQKFIDKGFITTFPDIYKLDRYKSEIINMQGFGKRSYDKLIDSIEKSKNVKLENFIFALGISNVGKGSSKIIAKAFGNDWFRFEDGLCNEFNFTSLEDFGEVIHKSIHSWFDNPHERKFWTELTYILNFIKEENKNVEIVDNPLKGMKVYATGSFKNFKKDEIKKVLEDLGCEFASGYSKSLDALIEGSLKSSSKVDKAKKDGIRVITEDEFMEMIGQS